MATTLAYRVVPRAVTHASLMMCFHLSTTDQVSMMAYALPSTSEFARQSRLERTAAVPKSMRISVSDQK